MTAPTKILGSAKERAFACACSVIRASEHLSRLQQQMLKNRSQAQGRKERESADDHNGGDKQAREQPARNGESSHRLRSDLFLGEISGYGQDWNVHEES